MIVSARQIRVRSRSRSRCPSGRRSRDPSPRATVSPLGLVVCTSSAAQPSRAVELARPAARRAPRPRAGPSASPGSGSFATSSDCTTTGARPSSGSTSYRIAATARCVNDTSRVEETRTAPPGRRDPLGACRRSTPARRSSTRSCLLQLAVADVERLVLDQQPDDLAVGDVDDRLAVLGVAVAGLGVRQRPRPRRSPPR